MGCVGSEVVDENQQMILKLTRLKHEIDSNIQKLRGQALKEQGLLLAEFKKPKSYRALAAENGFANSIVLKINKIHCYEIVRGHIQKILNYKTHLESEQNSKKSLIPSMSIILYSESILKDQSISNLCRAIRKKFPEIQEAKDEKIDSLIMLHHKKTQLPTTVMINQYLLKLINQESLDIAQVNQVGHNVKFG